MSFRLFTFALETHSCVWLNSTTRKPDVSGLFRYCRMSCTAAKRKPSQLAQPLATAPCVIYGLHSYKRDDSFSLRFPDPTLGKYHRLHYSFSTVLKKGFSLYISLIHHFYNVFPKDEKDIALRETGSFSSRPSQRTLLVLQWWWRRSKPHSSLRAAISFVLTGLPLSILLWMDLWSTSGGGFQ